MGRRKDISARMLFLIVAAAVSVALALSASLRCLSFNARKAPDHLRCAIEFGRHDDTTKGLLTGYNYHLLEKYAESLGSSLDISVSRRNDSYTDSLKNGSIDILVIPYADSLTVDSVLVSIPVDSISVWLMSHGEQAEMDRLNKWIDRYHRSEEYNSTRDLFLKTYDPIRRAWAGNMGEVLSPYDDIIREYADSIGWDWRLLAAVIYQESHFKIDARSHRGALGLMQMMPNTADRFNSGDLVNPRNSIRAGATYLGTLYKRYYNAKDSLERQKFTLAAYNAGEGRIKDVINYARFKKVPVNTWESASSVIEEMRDHELMSQIDTVKLGCFNGTETTYYVERVMSLYDAFKRICTTK